MSAAFFSVPLRALVQALAVERERGLARLGEPVRRLHDRRLVEPAQARRVLRRVVAHARLERLEAGGVRSDEGAVDEPSHSMTCSMPLNSATSLPGSSGRCRSANSAVSVRRGSATTTRMPGRARLASSMRRNRIGCANAMFEPAMKTRVGVRQVVVARGRRVGAQRQLVAGHRAAHAQARVGIEVVGADQPLDELVVDVVVLGQPLARAVEADGVGAVRRDDRGEAVGGLVERLVPADARERAAARRAALRMQQPRLRDHLARGRQVQRAALGAQAPEVGRMVGVAAHAGDARRRRSR